MTVQCCKCKKIRVEDKWMRPSHSFRDEISHGYCPLCLDEVFVEMDNHLASQRAMSGKNLGFA